MEWLKTQEWGLMILDEVHTIPGTEVEADYLCRYKLTHWGLQVTAVYSTY